MTTRSGAGDDLPGTVYLTCPICEASTVLLNGTYPVRYTCECGRYWHVVTGATQTHTTITYVLKEFADADAAAAGGFGRGPVD